MALAGAGAVRLAVNQPGSLRDPARSAILLGMLPLAVVMSAIDRLFPGDMVVLLPVAATLAMFGLEGLISLAVKWSRMPLRWGEGLLAGMLLVQIAVTLFSSWKLPPPRKTLEAQQAAAADLDRQIGSGSAQAFDNLWFVVLTHRRNVLPVVQTGRKATASNEAAGWGTSAIWQGLVEGQPALIILSSSLEDRFPDYFPDGYVRLEVSQPGQIWLRTGP